MPSASAHGYVRLHDPPDSRQKRLLQGLRASVTALVLVTLAISSFKAATVYHSSPYRSLSNRIFTKRIITDQQAELSTDLIYFNDEDIMHSAVQQLTEPKIT